VEYNRIIDAVKADSSEAMFPGNIADNLDQTDMEIEPICTELISVIENFAERKLKNSIRRRHCLTRSQKKSKFFRSISSNTLC
jgi:hypothetical protein